MLVGLKDFKERKVAVLVGLLKDMIKITDRLVIMKDQRKSNPRAHRGFPYVEVFFVAESRAPVRKLGPASLVYLIGQLAAVIYLVCPLTTKLKIACGLFGRYGIDRAEGAPFESSSNGKPGNNHHSPVIIGSGIAVKGGR